MAPQVFHNTHLKAKEVMAAMATPFDLVTVSKISAGKIQATRDVESGVYYKRHSLRGYVLNMFTTYGCSTSRLQYCTACLRLTDLAIV